MGSRNFLRPPGGLNGGIVMQPPPQIGLEQIEQVGKMPKLAAPYTFGVQGQLKIVGGMTQRLAVAAQLMSLTGGDCRAALSKADELIAMELGDRRPVEGQASQ